ncbi:MAG: heme exporter protein CcmD [Gammaproteobacteria bacterium]|nr:MAG: heme exporter protein CcmD [Gammaproteobacteria bacterium]
MSFQEFIEMGGYGPYIWSSYLIAAALFIGLFVSLKLQRNKLIKQLRRRYHQQSKQSQQ